MPVFWNPSEARPRAGWRLLLHAMLAAVLGAIPILFGVHLPFGVIASSAVFAALHATNDHATLMSTAGLFVNGLLFAIALLLLWRARSGVRDPSIQSVSLLRP